MKLVLIARRFSDVRCSESWLDCEVTDNGDASKRSVHVGRSNSLVETAKDRLVQFRRRHERLSEAQSDAIRVMLKGPDGDVHCAKAFGVDGSWITA